MDYRASEFYKNIFDFDILFLDANTPIYIFVLVLILMFALNTLLFKPIFRTLDNRKAHAESLRKQIEGHETDITALTASYNERLEEVKADVNRLRQDSRADSQKTIESILDRARREADAEFSAAMEELQTEVQQAKEELAQRAVGLAEGAANRILNV